MIGSFREGHRGIPVLIIQHIHFVFQPLITSTSKRFQCSQTMRSESALEDSRTSG